MTSPRLDAVHRALDQNDAVVVRELAHDALGTDELDDVLAALAGRAGDRGDLPLEPGARQLALDVLLETLDASGVIRRFAGAALLDHSAVDDVSQDALISIASSIDSYTGRGKVTSWVHTIVRNRVVDHLRRQRATAPLDDDVAPAARMSSIIATRATVRQILEELPELYRDALVLRDIEGHSYAEVAEKLQRPTGTVKAQINRGRALVAARLRETDGERA